MSDSIDQILQTWAADENHGPSITHVRVTPERAPRFADLIPPPPPAIAAALAERGINRFYSHQAEAVTRLRSGRHTVVVAATASGKSLSYQLPIAESVAGGDGTALLVYPTKALSQDQLRGFSRLGVDGLVAATYDGDTHPDSRRWIRRNADVVLTNPDMLHVGVLPNHQSWAHFFSKLRYVVVDELHVLRGIFGSHVAHIMRRAKRVAAHYGSTPTFAFTSATIGNPGELAEALIGEPVDVIDNDGSPAGKKTWVLWNPPLAEDGSAERGSPLTAATEVFSDLVSKELHTIAFARSRKSSELMLRWSRDRIGGSQAKRIASYRGGYLPAERRAIESALFSGELLGVTTTNALELGIDVGALDAAVITTFPGTIASFRQQAGRAGRTTEHSLAVLVAGKDALDQYYITHPDDLFGRRVESAVVNPANPDVMTDHIGCAANELPLVPEDRAFLGDDLEVMIPAMVSDGRLRLRNGELFWSGRRSPATAVDIRTSGGPAYTIGDERGRLLGSVDEERAFTQCHTGAVYLHQGDGYVVEHLDLKHHEVRVRRGEVPYYTQPKTDKDLTVVTTTEEKAVGAIRAAHGRVAVETRMLGYRKVSIKTGQVLDTVPLDLPTRRLTTQALWYVFTDGVLEPAGITPRRAPGTLHAAEHTAIAMLPLFAVCDRWDVGGLSITFHPQLGAPAFFIYDGYQGGAGIAPIGYHAATDHLAAALEVLETCPCAMGCPSCVQSPKCGNFNDPLDKAGAAALLRTALSG